MNKYCLYVYAFVALLCTFESFAILINDFSKVILVLAFISMTVAQCYYLILKSELEKACYSPNYSTLEIFSPNLLNLKCLVMDRLGKFVEARLTNWDENSIFLALNSPNILNGSYVDIEIHSFGRVFKQSGHVVCEFVKGQGIGVELDKSNTGDQFNWSQFFNICEDMGHISKLTR